MTTTALTVATALYAAASLTAPVPVEDRIGMIDAVTAIAAGADRHDWPRVRAAFADEVTLDYTSLFGGEVTTQAADDVVTQWSDFLPGFDATLHLVTNHTITAFDGGSAMMEADFHALHRIGSDQWTLSGHYSYALVKQDDRWAVKGLTMTWTHESGDRGLVGQAAARAAEGADDTR